jgi:hypothetical protein
MSNDIWQEPWDQEKFEQYLIEWIITCDQPFEKVKKLELIMIMNFTYHSDGLLKIPKCNGIKHQVIKMGEKMIERVYEMFMV